MLRVGDRAAFKTWNGTLMTGKVVAIMLSGMYLVIGDHEPCSMFADGLFRYCHRQVVN